MFNRKIRKNANNLWPIYVDKLAADNTPENLNALISNKLLDLSSRYGILSLHESTSPKYITSSSINVRAANYSDPGDIYTIYMNGISVGELSLNAYDEGNSNWDNASAVGIALDCFREIFFFADVKYNENFMFDIYDHTMRSTFALNIQTGKNRSSIVFVSLVLSLEMASVFSF